MRFTGSNVSVFPQRGTPSQVGFERRELDRILNLYGRMVAAGHWKDYAMDMRRDVAIFAAFAGHRSDLRSGSRNVRQNAIGKACGHCTGNRARY